MTTRPELPEAPTRVARLPVDHRGYPVPWFVAWLDDDGKETAAGHGTADFRVIASGKITDAIRRRRCWICGDPLGRNVAYVIGPMCAVNRISAEPPSHLECALYAATACPFLTRPHMVRRENDLPGEAQDLPGTPIKRNPGLALVWVTRDDLRPFQPGEDAGVLFHVGSPSHLFWVAEGRAATHEEVMASFASGLPALIEAASEQGELAVAQLDQQIDRALALVPA